MKEIDRIKQQLEHMQMVLHVCMCAKEGAHTHTLC